MKKTNLALAALFLLTLSIFASAQGSEMDAVRVPLENYLKGHATGDGEYFKKAFHTEGNLIFIRDGKYTTRSFAEYIAGATGKPAADEAQRTRSIDSLDVSGNAAMARVTLDYPGGTFTDYFVLLKVDGEWKIANKVWTRAEAGDTVNAYIRHSPPRI